ncbi:Alpha/Beta hydrolase protein [Lentinula aff. detonsa]|uniref:Carboxylic ester hydrolase n=1 Tax=Lentinula aff. detonsa TaxID=2804958 RepID=A0AA38L3Q8_9AGAR|nr:Alpha/Beta hydrolase protein [Lentinula aff. detonsa]KAJ3792884.1 Alpha/Beta hydrolase protein [Lentinula aff. detonsa]
MHLRNLISLAPVVNQAAALVSPLGPVVNLGYAAFAGNSTSPSGITNSNVTFFGGIPYAEPPLSNLRWRAPKMLNENAVTSTVTDARNWGPPCIQTPAVVGVGSEDCLTLNVWKPTNMSAGDKLPVAGGGFYAGSPQGFPLYDWVSQHPTGIIGASITYRLGMLGFFGGPDIDGASDNIDLNVGLLDQRAALEWLQRHVDKFGGDPENITIYGESAGGASMVMHVTAYGGTRPIPFKRVVTESIGFGPTMTNAQIEQYTNASASFVGCPTSGTKMFTCMREASVGKYSAIVGAINSIPAGKFAPVVEGPGGFMPDLPSRLIHSGNFSTVDALIAGHCTGDGKTFAGGSPDQFVTEDDVKDIVFSRWPSVSNETRDQALAMYPVPNTTDTEINSEWDRAWLMAGEIIFTCMDWFLAEAMLNRSVENVFSYAWNAPDTVLFDEKPYLGAMHTSDLYFLFDGQHRLLLTLANAGNSFTAFNASESVVSKEAIAYWTSFSQFGHPSSTKLSTSPAWEVFAPINSTRQRLLITEGNDTVTASQMQLVSSAERERCMFWMSEDVTSQTRV